MAAHNLTAISYQHLLLFITAVAFGIHSEMLESLGTCVWEDNVGMLRACAYKTAVHDSSFKKYHWFRAVLRPIHIGLEPK